MPRVRLETLSEAPPERVFDLARSIDLHAKGQARHRERAIAGVRSGLIGPGQIVTWEARHFGITQRLTSRIVAFDRPRSFRDSMVSGAFARFDHDHLFEVEGPGTLMTDLFDFESPLGPLGRLADCLFLTRYMSTLIGERALSSDWTWLNPSRASAPDPWRQVLTKCSSAAGRQARLSRRTRTPSMRTP